MPINYDEIDSNEESINNLYNPNHPDGQAYLNSAKTKLDNHLKLIGQDPYHKIHAHPSNLANTLNHYYEVMERQNNFRSNGGKLTPKHLLNIQRLAINHADHHINRIRAQGMRTEGTMNKSQRIRAIFEGNVIAMYSPDDERYKAAEKANRRRVSMQAQARAEQARGSHVTAGQKTIDTLGKNLSPEMLRKVMQKDIKAHHERRRKSVNSSTEYYRAGLKALFEELGERLGLKSLKPGVSPMGVSHSVKDYQGHRQKTRGAPDKTRGVSGDVANFPTSYAKTVAGRTPEGSPANLLAKRIAKLK
jgi:hypothetical protein